MCNSIQIIQSYVIIVTQIRNVHSSHQCNNNNNNQNVTNNGHIQILI